MNPTTTALRAALGTVLFSALLSAQGVTVNPPTLTFRYVTNLSDQPLPPPQTLQISAPGKSFTVVPYPDPTLGVSFLSLSPDPSFVYQNTATVIVNIPGVVTNSDPVVPIRQIGRGTLFGKLKVISDSSVLAEIPVNLGLNYSTDLIPHVSSIVNGASFLPGPIAPGELVTLFGSNLGPSSPSYGRALPPAGDLTQTTAAYSVTMNGYFAPLYYVQANQINAIVPFEIAGASSVQVIVFGFGREDPSDIVIQPAASTAPGILTAANGTGQGIVFNNNGSLNGDGRPATAGSVVHIYTTGSGLWTTPARDGQDFSPVPFMPQANVSVTIGGAPAAVVTAQAPNLLGGSAFLDIGCVVPDGLAAGPQPIVVTFGDQSSVQQMVTMIVQ